jgi:putative NADH-flavin reductase
VRVTIFGATGRTGRLAVVEALRRGLDVTALVRDRTKAAFDEAVRVVEGEGREAGAVTSALEEAQAVISVMAIPEGTEPITDLSDATRTIAAAMERSALRRLVIAVNSAVFHDRPVKPPYDVVAEEHRRDLATLRASSLDWTALAPTFLTDDEPRGTYVVEVDAKAPGAGLPRGDLAIAVLDALDHDEWIGHALGASTPPNDRT